MLAERPLSDIELSSGDIGRKVRLDMLFGCTAEAARATR